MWRDEGLWKPRAEMTDDERAALDGREFSQLEQEQFVSAGQQMGLGENVRVGPMVDASQLAPGDWPGEVIDLRRR